VNSAKTEVWAIRPLTGITITDEDAGLDKPIFGDATLFARGQLEAITKLIPPSSYRDGNRSAYFGGPFAEKGIHSFLAVRRQSYFDPEHDVDFEKDFNPRVYELTSLIALAVLIYSNRLETCCLTEDFAGNQRSQLYVAPGSGSMESVSGDWSLMHLSLGVSYSREELLTLLKRPEILCLSEILLPQKKTISSSLYQAASQATIRLAEVFHTLKPVNQLLGAVTALELLLGEHGDSFDVLQRRAVALLGESFIKEVGLKEVLQHRHLYVHRGQTFEDRNIPLRGASIAAAALLKFADLASKVPDKMSLLNYLDFVSKADGMCPSLDEESRTHLNGLLKHSRANSELHFFTIFTK
jgi:hypothetical protein